MAENKFPSEVIDLPSDGKFYPKESPLSKGKLEIKYMTAREEDILTSQNLVKKGIVIDKLLNSLIITKDVDVNDLILGDKNAVMVAARILAYGPEYTCDVENPFTGDSVSYTFNLADCPFRELSKDIDYSSNEFSVDLPASKTNIKFKLLNGREESQITEEIKRTSKFGQSSEVTTRLRHIIIEVDGSREQSVINNFVNNMLSRDSLHLRGKIQNITPDIDLKQEVEMEGEMVEVDIPLTTNFFWPTART